MYLTYFLFPEATRIRIDIFFKTTVTEDLMVIVYLKVFIVYLCKVMEAHICSVPGGSDGKASACNVGDLGSIPGSGRSPGEGNGNPLQYSCLKNPMD